jgi:hypothetical protein
MPGRLQRFRATIAKHGVNAFVDVPARISGAFAGHARAGRITVEGTLNGAPFRATLVPTRGGPHRLFVNGGMRSAAGVGVGDVVSIGVQATAPEAVRPPRDVAGALRRAGVLEAFNRLPPSHRRELLRYVADARTPETRARYIRRCIDHVRGTPVPSGSRRPSPALWTCPACGHQFVNRNQWHSCARVDLDEPFRGRPARIRELFDRLRATVESMGPVTLVPYRHRVAFMVRVRFAGAVPRSRWLEVGLWLTRRLDDPRFRKVETIAPNVHLHLLRIEDASQIDAQVAGWLREAYAVGCQEHLA